MNPARRALLPLPHLFFLLIQILVETTQFAVQLLVELLDGLVVALRLRLRDFTAEEQFLFRLLRLVERLQFVDFPLLRFGQLGGGGLLFQAFHGEFVGAFHIGMIARCFRNASSYRPRPVIRLISTDFDGTLVNHDRRPAVVPDLFIALRELRERGVHWAVNTGRTLGHLEQGLTTEFGFPVGPDFAVVEERDIYRRGDGGKWEPFGDWNSRAETDHAELFRMAGPLLAEVLAFLERFQGATAIHDRGRFIGAITANDADMDRLCGFLDKMRARLPVFSYQRNTIYVRFCHEAYSKGTALGELARMLGIPHDAIFAAGDHHNDIPMLDGGFARWVACPGNSCEEVKLTVRTAGGYLAEGEASAGVVEALRHFGFWSAVAV